MKKFLQEFKSFAMRGNVLDMAIGIIIGAAFGKIVTSLVSDIIMPLIGVVTGGLNFTSWKITLRAATETDPGLFVSYGNFIQVLFDFLIIAWVIFLLVRGINRLSAKKEAEKPAPEPPATPEDIQLLREIRDSLKK
ncbi:MAG: large-conductance mechanosensitive channel protein MscL [Bacteroidales bacterium]|nr:large-conductance mechanosensitive channel protein MscL [Bacteroidales bacterium]MDD4669885.1 large-conductance mechanosensitive channel protein MscL [Bacteroidales bacterium]